jgi:hypothetical protein
MSREWPKVTEAPSSAGQLVPGVLNACKLKKDGLNILISTFKGE